MLDFGFYNMDCLEGMRQFPDNYFELAIVDPPYGDGGGYLDERNEVRTTIRQIPRTGIRGKTYPGGSPDTNRGGFETLHFRSEKIQQDLSGPAEPGRANSEKNHRVGRCAGSVVL